MLGQLVRAVTIACEVWDGWTVLRKCHSSYSREEKVAISGEAIGSEGERSGVEEL